MSKSTSFHPPLSTDMLSSRSRFVSMLITSHDVADEIDRLRNELRKANAQWAEETQAHAAFAKMATEDLEKLASERGALALDRRVPVQGFGNAHLSVNHPEREPDAKPDGTITWAEHLWAHWFYEKRYGDIQDAKTIARRGGFGYNEIVDLTGHHQRTWKPRVS